MNRKNNEVGMVSDYKILTQRANFLEIGFGESPSETAGSQLAETMSVNDQDNQVQHLFLT